ncbi:MAG: hypothetical protein LAP21_19825 [Acidobacteriia bacterium]|nr:hypothetical protein [Terriglobia bacterium]
MFSVDLDRDGDIDTDVVLTQEQANLAVEGVAASQADIAFGVALHLCLRTQVPVELTEPLSPQNTPGPALGSPQLMVPLRT